MKLKKFLVLGLATLSIMKVLTSCSSEKIELQNKLNDTALDKINITETVKLEKPKVYDKFTFTGADFTQIGDKYDIDISGIATVANSSVKHYINMEYNVECSFFQDISQDDTTKLYQALDYVIQNYEVKNYSSVAVNSINKFNNSVHENVKREEGNYDLSKSFTYGIDNLQIDEEKGTVSFDTRQNVLYTNQVTQIVPIYNGKSYIYLPRTTTYSKYRNQSYRITIKATPEEIAEMKKDNSKVIDKFIVVVENKKTGEYSVEQLYNVEEKTFNDGVSQDIERDL